MPEALTLLAQILAIGVGATIVMDIVAVLLHRFLGIPFPDYALVGRWVGHMAHGQFRHGSIAKAAPIVGERTTGWIVHYLTGIAYAALLLGIWGVGWASNPTLVPALVTGLATIVAPFLVMQPAFGLGIAASKHPHPMAARLRSLSAHLSFGFGLYLAAKAGVLLQASA